MQRIKKIVDKYSYSTENVSAKTGEKVYDSIKNFGIAIAKSKLEKMGVSWSTVSSSPAAITPSPPQGNSSTGSESPKKEQKK